MLNNLSILLTEGRKNLDYLPQFFRLTNEKDRDALSALIEQNPSIQICDEIEGQLRELIKSEHPTRKLTESEYEAYLAERYAGQSPQLYGVWVYYSWCNRIVHLLDEQEFIEVRTTRNQNKITVDEREKLAQKKIGVIGLSVGKSVALTLAMERGFGELRIADFDIVELSNLNRIQTATSNLGVPKTIVVAREIAEIDPFLKVTIFNEGINDENIDAFFNAGGRLDLLIEECDGLDVKIKARIKAKELGVPVLMDTSDRGMLDIERFDLDPERPILHGLVDHLNFDDVDLRSMTNEEKIPYVLPMLGIDDISKRMKASMMEIEQTLTTWPQLATSVILGGALTGDVARRILLDQYHESGRFYIDLHTLLADQTAPVEESPKFVAPEELAIAAIKASISNVKEVDDQAMELSNEQLKKIISAGILAPSGGNCQPWKMVYEAQSLFVFHDHSKSFSLLDYNDMGSYLSIGAVIENMVLKAHELGLEVSTQHYNTENNSRLVAKLRFFKAGDIPANDVENHEVDPLVLQIEHRITNRAFNERIQINPSVLEQISSITSTVSGAQLQFATSTTDLATLAKVIAGVDRLRILHERGHHDFMNEMRWNEAENLATRDGIDLETLDLTPSDRAGLEMARDWKAIELLAEWKTGKAFEKMTHRQLDGAGAIGFLTMPDYSQKSFYDGGRALQRIWLECTRLGIAFQPVSPSTFFFARMLHGAGEELPEWMRAELGELRSLFTQTFSTHNQNGEIFLFRLFKSDNTPVKSLRKPIDEILIQI